MLQFSCCQSCYLDLEEKQPRLALIWVCICKSFVQLNSMVCPYKETTAIKDLKKLEKLQYLITTDTDRGLLIRPNNKYIDDKSLVFCRDMKRNY